MTAAQMRELLAARAAGRPEPETPKLRPAGGTLCVHAEDSGRAAFPHRPCLGHRVECRKTEIVTCAANCRSDKCKFYEED